MKQLIGRRVNGVYLSPDKDLIDFDTDQGPVQFDAEADCCSESWFNHIEGLNALLGQVVESVEQVDMEGINEGEPGFSGRQECDSLFSIKLKTQRGVCGIEFRNSSNGYYGGSAQLVYKLTDRATLTQVTEDF
jgi:hypothetical protein